MDLVIHATETVEKSFMTEWLGWEGTPGFKPSAITMTIQKQWMASSLSTCGCLFKISLTWSSFTESRHDFFQIFPLAWEARDLWMSALAVKTEAKQGLSTSTFFQGLGCQVPHSIQQQSNIFLASLLLLMHAQQLFLPFTALTRFNSQWTLAFLAPSLHTHCLYIPCIILSLLLPLVCLLLCFSSIRRDMFSHMDLLPPLTGLVHSKRDHIWPGEDYSWKSSSSPGPLFSLGQHCMGNF